MGIEVPEGCFLTMGKGVEKCMDAGDHILHAVFEKFALLVILVDLIECLRGINGA